jgi:hypothetical protein
LDRSQNDKNIDLQCHIIPIKAQERHDSRQ